MFDNIHIGSEVDVCRSNGIILGGKVKWKGSIANRSGDWIGVELFYPEGSHDGLLNRRRYYQCRANHGLFIRPWQVRFAKRNSRKIAPDTFRCISKQSIADETLFFNGKEKDAGIKSSITLSSSVYNEIKDITKGKSCNFVYEEKPVHRRSHLVGGRLKAAKEDSPVDSLSSQTSSNYLRKSDPSYNFFLINSLRDEETFRSPSSIPVTDRTPAHCHSTSKFYHMNSIALHSLSKTI